MGFHKDISMILYQLQIIIILILIFRRDTPHWRRSVHSWTQWSLVLSQWVEKRKLSPLIIARSDKSPMILTNIAISSLPVMNVMNRLWLSWPIFYARVWITNRRTPLEHSAWFWKSTALVISSKASIVWLNIKITTPSVLHIM